MEITVGGYIAGSHLLEKSDEPWDAIVILDSRLVQTEFVQNNSRRHLYLRFDDVVSAKGGKHIPASDDILQAIDFAADADRLLVCCRAGQSRSAAVAFLIAFRYLGPKAAYQLLNPRRHIPNKLITNIGEGILDNQLVGSTIEQCWRDHSKFKLSDYYDEISDELDELESQGARNLITEK
jgi:predicted protein tyrosine phosphatase